MGAKNAGLPWESMARTGHVHGRRKCSEQGRLDPHPEGARAGERGKAADPSNIENERLPTGSHGGQGGAQRLQALRTHPAEEFERDMEILGLGPCNARGIGLKTPEQRLDARPPITRERDRHETSDIIRPHATWRDQPGPTLSCCGFLGAAP